MKKRKGSALVLAICIFVVMIFFGIIVTSLTMNNALAARKQRERVQAYYLVLSGIELGTNAVLQKATIGGVEVHELLYEYSHNPSKAPLEDTVVFSVASATEEGKTVSLTIKAVTSTGDEIIGSINPDDVWVEISAVGTITNAGGSTSHAGNIRILATDPAVISRNIMNPSDY